MNPPTVEMDPSVLTSDAYWDYPVANPKPPFPSFESGRAALEAWRMRRDQGLAYHMGELAMSAHDGYVMGQYDIGDDLPEPGLGEGLVIKAVVDSRVMVAPDSPRAQELAELRPTLDRQATEGNPESIARQILHPSSFANKMTIHFEDRPDGSTIIFTRKAQYLLSDSRFRSFAAIEGAMVVTGMEVLMPIPKLTVGTMFRDISNQTAKIMAASLIQPEEEYPMESLHKEPARKRFTISLPQGVLGPNPSAHPF